MLKILIIVLLSFTYLKSEWIEEGDYLKLNHDMTNISEMRYSIDTTHIILINSEKINYYNKYTGEFSKSFSIPVLSDISDTLKDFTNPILSIDEKIISYTNTIAENEDNLSEIEEAYYNIEKNSFLGISGQNKFNSYPLYGSYQDFSLILESKDNSIKYNIYSGSLPKSWIISGYSFRNTLTDISSKRIETINPFLKFNHNNKDVICFNERLKKMQLIKNGKTINNGFGIYTDSYYSFLNSLKGVMQVLTFANDFEHYFIIDTNGMLNKFNYIKNENNIIPSKINYSKVYYLSDNKFLGQNGKEHYILDGNNLDKLYKYHTEFNSDISFFDSTNFDFYYKDIDSINIYKQNKKINELDTLVASFSSPEFAIVNKEVQFINTSIGNYDDIHWEFEKDKFSADKNPSHTFTKFGTYPVKLTITNGLNEKIFVKNINIYENIKADFDIEIVSKEKPLKIKIINNVKDYNYLSWYLNNNQINLLKDSTIIINEYGVYNIKQYVSDEHSRDELIKSIQLFPTLFDINVLSFKTTAKNKVNIDYFNNQDIFHCTYIEGYKIKFYSIDNNGIKYNEMYFIAKHVLWEPKNPSIGLYQEGYSQIMTQNIPTLFYNSNKLKYFENTLFDTVSYVYSYPPGYEFSGGYSVDTTKNVFSENSIYDISLLNDEQAIINQAQSIKVTSKFNRYYEFKDDYPKTLMLNNKKYFVQNHQLYYFDFIDEKVSFYDEVFKDLSEYYLTKINSEVNLFYKDLSNNWFNVKLDDNNKLVKSNFQFNNKIAIKDIFGLDYHLYLLSANNKIYEYDLTTKTETELKNIELDSIQVMEELGGNLVLFGKKDGNLAYQILNNNDSYTHKYDELKGNFISAKTNNKDKYVAQVNFDIDTTNTYLILMDIYEFLKVNLNQDNPISVFNNVIVSNDNIDEVYIYDLLGRNVISESNYIGTVFHINSLKQGFYLYRIKSNKNCLTGKFIKEK